MNDLIQWLKAQIDEDERKWQAEIDTKRRILDLYNKTRLWSEKSAGATAGYALIVTKEALRLLAQPYAGRDGWREEWQAPDEP